MEGRRIFKNGVVLAFASIASACMSSELVQLSPDTYILRKEDHGGIFAFNRGKMMPEAIREANAFAESKGKIAIPISTQEHPVGILGDWASFEYQFRVLDKNDPEARRTSLQPTPATLRIEADERVKQEVTVKTHGDSDMYTELQKLKSLKDSGILTEQEFEQQKKRILERY